MRRYRVIWSAVFGISCFPELEISPRSDDGLANGDGSGSGATSDDSVLGTLELSVAEPYHGSNIGGLETYFGGGPFDQSLRVWFADEEAEVVAVTESGARVIVPAYDGEGAVSIRVTTDEGEGRTPLGFRYWEDQSGNTVLAGFLYQYQWMNESGDGSSTAVSQLMLMEPVDWSILDRLAPGIDECGQGGEIPSLVPSPDEAVLSSDAIEITLERYEDTDVLYYQSDAQEFDLRNQQYDLELSVGGTYPGQIIENALELSEGLRTVGVDISEYDTWLDNPDTLNIASDDLRWAGASGDYVYLSFYDEEDPSRSFHCLVENDGSFTLSASDFFGFESSTGYGWEDWEYLEGPYFDAYIRLMDIHVTESILDFNNGVASLIAGAGIVGQARFWDPQ